MQLEKPDKKQTLVLMAGFPGSGKTTLATELGRLLGYPVLDKDWLKVAFLNDGQNEEQAGWLAYEAILAVAEHMLVKQGLSVIVDCSAHYPFVVERLHQIAESINACFKVILCVVDCEIRSRRIRERKEYDGLFSYHQVRPSTIQEDIRAFAHLPSFPTTYILDTTLPLAHCLLQAQKHLKTV